MTRTYEDLSWEIRFKARRFMPTLRGCLHMARHPVRLARFLFAERRLPSKCTLSELREGRAGCAAGRE